jgi:hypothetical protein
VAVPSQAPEITRRFAVPRPGRAAARFVAGTLLGVLLVFGAIVGFGATFDGKILPGVSIGTVDVSGLTRPQAQAALDTAFDRLETGQITVRSSRDSMAISFADVDRRVDDDAMLDEAMAVGAAGTASTMRSPRCAA